jgi:hypothetical protein
VLPLTGQGTTFLNPEVLLLDEPLYAGIADLHVLLMQRIELAATISALGEALQDLFSCLDFMERQAWPRKT